MDPHIRCLGADFQEKETLDTQQGKECNESLHLPGKHGPVIGKHGYDSCTYEDHAYEGEYQKGVGVFLPGYHVFILDAFQLGLFQIAKFCKLF